MELAAFAETRFSCSAFILFGALYQMKHKTGRALEAGN